MIKESNFDEAQYLNMYPDVKAAVRSGKFRSGYEHFKLHGSLERRNCPRLDVPKEDILVSVVVPNYNKVDFIDHTVESVLNQDYRNIDLIVVDDVSTDGSVESVSFYLDNDPRIRLINHRSNSGGCAAPRNTGIHHARGEVICFLDSDDIIYNGCIRTRVEAYNRYARFNDEVAGVYSGTESIGFGFVGFPNVKPVSDLGTVDFISAAGDCPFNSNQPMLKASVLRKFGGFDESLTQAEDWHLWLRLVRHGYLFKFTGYNGVGYRNCPASMVSKDSTQHIVNGTKLLFSAHEAIDTEQVVEGTPCLYDKPWIDYKKQILVSDRVFSFLSMDDANDFKGELIDMLMPDLDKIGSHIKSYESIVVGQKRKIANYQEPTNSIASLIGRTVLRKMINLIRNNRKLELPESQITHPNAISYQELHRSDIFLFPHSAYHVMELFYVAQELEKAGFKPIFVNSEVVYRNQGVVDKLKELNLAYISYGNLVLYDFLPKAAICLCDWDLVVRPVIEDYKLRGVLTFGIVEGVQDFLDVDTGRSRCAYKTVEYLFLPGEFDLKYFEEKEKKYVTGLSRIDFLLADRSEEVKSNDVLVNLNFTYGVLEDKRDSWLSDVVSSVKKLSVKYMISQHPADKAELDGYHVAKGNLYDQLKASKVLVTRFSTVVYEALALRTPVVYYNPNIEKVDKFKEPLGAYEYAQTPSELEFSISKALDNGWSYYRDSAERFLSLHCNTEKSETSAVMICRTIKKLLDCAGGKVS